jgi:hypothetical protein
MHGCDRRQEHADYEFGAQARLDNEPFDREQPKCWQGGWRHIDEPLRAFLASFTRTESPANAALGTSLPNILRSTDRDCHPAPNVCHHT